MKETNNLNELKTIRINQNLSISISKIEPQYFNKNDWDEYCEYTELINEEYDSAIPFKPRDLLKKEILTEYAEKKEFRYIVLNQKDKKIIGHGYLSYDTEESAAYEESKDRVYVWISVSKKFRRYRIGSLLLKHILLEAKKYDKVKIQTDTAFESGIKFINKLKVKIESDRSINRLNLNDIDWNQMEEWSSNTARKEGAILEFFEIVPEKYLDIYCQVYNKCSNMTPDNQGDIILDEITSPKNRRSDENKMVKLNWKWVTIISKENDGKISGLLDFYYARDSYPCEITQGLTGVLSVFRKRGLGKWLKSEMLLYVKERIYEEFKSVKYIETGNNNSNVPILTINHQMGYKKFRSHVMCSTKIEDLLHNLDNIINEQPINPK